MAECPFWRQYKNVKIMLTEKMPNGLRIQRQALNLSPMLLYTPSFSPRRCYPTLDNDSLASPESKVNYILLPRPACTAVPGEGQRCQIIVGNALHSRSF